MSLWVYMFSAIRFAMNADSCPSGNSTVYLLISPTSQYQKPSHLLLGDSLEHLCRCLVPQASWWIHSLVLLTAQSPHSHPDRHHHHGRVGRLGCLQQGNSVFLISWPMTSAIFLLNAACAANSPA